MAIVENGIARHNIVVLDKTREVISIERFNEKFIIVVRHRVNFNFRIQ